MRKQNGEIKGEGPKKKEEDNDTEIGEKEE